MHAWEWDAVRLMLLLEPTGTKAKLDSSTTHLVYLGNADGQDARMTERGSSDESAEANR